MHRAHMGPVAIIMLALLRLLAFHRVATFASSKPSAALPQGSMNSDASAHAPTATIAFSYELLVGADGAGSKVRQLMQVN